MEIILHRVNSIAAVKKLDKKWGVEIDVRAEGGSLILNHEPLSGGELLEEYLEHCKNRFVIFNLKEAGIESRVIELAREYGVREYFLLDVEFPYLYRASRQENVRAIAVRYSEAESIETVLLQKNLVDWVWIDTNTKLPLDKKTVKQLTGFRTCLVSPDRWGRPDDIQPYRQQIIKLGLELDAVMVGEEYVELWQ